MENYFQCTEHKKNIELICCTCKTLICSKCCKSHEQKGCKGLIDVGSYAEKEILPEIKERIDTIEKQQSIIDANINEDKDLLEYTTKMLLHLEIKLKEWLFSIAKAANIVKSLKNKYKVTIDSIKKSIMYDYKRFQKAIENDDVKYIITQIKEGSKIYTNGLDDNNRNMLLAIKSCLEKIETIDEFDKLNNSLTTLNTNSIKIIEYPYNSLDAEFVYGICEPELQRKMLCRYEIETKQLTNVVEVPRYCSILQMGRIVYISGGGNPISNQLSCYDEESEKLKILCSMYYQKYDHASEAISPKSFAIVGGGDCNNRAIPYCEEYNTIANACNPLPSLNIERYDTGTAFLDNKFLYAIGGYDSNNTIEMLDTSEITQWKLVSIEETKLRFDDTPAAFAISNTEIMILCGGETKNAAIFNSDNSSIVAYPNDLIRDYYECNSVFLIHGLAYIIGTNGHMHIFDITERTFTEYEYSKITKAHN